MEYVFDGALIRTLRNERGWTAEELVEGLDCSAQYLYRIERGDEKPSFKVLSQIARKLDIPPTLLISRDPIDTPAVLEVGSNRFEVPPELIEPLIDIIFRFNKTR